MTKLDNALQIRLSRITKIEDFQWKRKKELISNKYISAFDFAEMTWLVLWGAKTDNCVTSSVTVIGAPTEISSTSVSLVFLYSTGILKKV